MANSQNFRSAFNGFNREDVVHYLEYLNSKHSTLINQLSEETETLRQKLSHAAEAISSDSSRAERVTALEQEVEELRQQRDEAAQAAETANTARTTLEAECVSLQEQLTAALAAEAELREKCTRLEAQLQTQTTQAAVFSTSTAMKELEAYRRAERIERMAQERADQIYRKTNGILAEASLRVDQVAADIGGVADQVVQQLQLLQQAVTGSKQALQDAAAVMYAIRPEAEEF